MHTRATQNFHRGLLLMTQRKEKEFQRNTLKYSSLVFVFLKKGKEEREKLFTRESSQQAKEEQEIFFAFL